MINSLTGLPSTKVTCAMTEAEVAEYIGMSRSFLRQCRCRKSGVGAPRGPRYLKIGVSVRYRKRDIDEWIDSLAVGA